MGNNHKQKR